MLKVIRDKKELLEIKGKRERLDKKEPQVTKALKVKSVRKVRRVLPEIKDRKVLRVHSGLLRLVLL